MKFKLFLFFSVYIASFYAAESTEENLVLSILQELCKEHKELAIARDRALLIREETNAGQQKREDLIKITEQVDRALRLLLPLPQSYQRDEGMKFLKKKEFHQPKYMKVY